MTSNTSLPRTVAGVETAIVGRETVRQQLQEALRTVQEQGHCQIVTISGEAGVGKTRLLGDFHRWAAAQSPTPVILLGRATPEWRGQPYALVRDLISRHCQIREDDPPAEVMEKLAAALREPLATGKGITERVLLIGYLVGFPFGTMERPVSPLDDAEQLLDRARAALYDCFAALAERSPLLLLLEDLDQADTSSRDLVDWLATRLGNRPLLVMGTAQSMATPPVSREIGQESAYEIKLSPLSRRESRQLVDNILRRVDDVPELVRNLILEHAKGNPLYIEESIRLLIQTGVITGEQEPWSVHLDRLSLVSLPITLTELLQTRLSKLPAAERTTLQQAAVLGQCFWEEAVEALGRQEKSPVTDLLAALAERGFISRAADSSFGDTIEYTFQHPLYRQIAYGSVPQQDLRLYHARAANWLNVRSRERAAIYAGRIAEHLEAAGQPGRAASYLGRAGEQALQVYAYRPAQNLFERALALLPRESPVRATLSLRAGEALYRLRDFPAARHRLEDSVAFIQRTGDPTYLGFALELLAAIGRDQGDFTVARKWIEQRLALAHAGSDEAGQSRALIELSWIIYREGDYLQARAQAEEALALCQSVGDRSLLARILNVLAAIALRLGEDSAAAQALLTQSSNLFRELGNRRGMASVANNLGVLNWQQRDYDAASRYYEEALALSEEVGDWPNFANTADNIGHIDAARGNYAAARARFLQGLRVAAPRGVITVVLESLGGLAIVLAHTGQTERALELLGLVLDHPALRSDTRITLQPIVDDLSNRVPPEAFEAGLAQGRALRLEKVAGQMLAEEQA
jgi:predicted ATPase